MNNPFDFFDKIYCIHLTKDTARKEHMQHEFEKVGISDRVEYISAPRPYDGFEISNMKRDAGGEFGCNLSQIKAIVHAIESKAKNVLIFEDDVEFFIDINERLHECLTTLPDDWGVFYLSGKPCQSPIIFNDQLVKTKRMISATAYAISGDHLLSFFNFWLGGIGSPSPQAPYDYILSNYAEKYNGYCAYPILCSVVDDMQSTITGGYNEHIGGSIVKHIEDGWKQFPPR